MYLSFFFIKITVQKLASGLRADLVEVGGRMCQDVAAFFFFIRIAVQKLASRLKADVVGIGRRINRVQDVAVFFFIRNIFCNTY